MAQQSALYTRPFTVKAVYYLPLIWLRLGMCYRLTKLHQPRSPANQRAPGPAPTTSPTNGAPRTVTSRGWAGQSHFSTGIRRRRAAATGTWPKFVMRARVRHNYRGGAARHPTHRSPTGGGRRGAGGGGGSGGGGSRPKMAGGRGGGTAAQRHRLLQGLAATLRHRGLVWWQRQVTLGPWAGVAAGRRWWACDGSYGRWWRGRRGRAVPCA